ncbi:hypothetical protein CI102_8463 [Trichoderma harzianum]|nr:hypothetical protein CI102_8463 [Trichoderma harzianum]
MHLRLLMHLLLLRHLLLLMHLLRLCFHGSALFDLFVFVIIALLKNGFSFSVDILFLDVSFKLH